MRSTPETACSRRQVAATRRTISWRYAPFRNERVAALRPGQPGREAAGLVVLVLASRCLWRRSAVLRERGPRVAVGTDARAQLVVLRRWRAYRVTSGRIGRDRVADSSEVGAVHERRRTV